MVTIFRENESNTTERDAFLRVLDARTGSLANATDEYLEALRREVYTWLQSIETAQWLRAKDAEEARLAAEEESRAAIEAELDNLRRRCEEDLRLGFRAWRTR